MNIFQAGPRDWPEDFKFENGNYQNKCMFCENFFYGYKRRICCKLCSEDQNGHTDTQQEGT